jgi:catechol 2,3-dioxygenase-like lactoylglutathione lyase family enzyme
VVRRSLGAVALLVRDYNEAIAWFTQMLGFVLVEDTELGAGKRWVLVAPDAGPGTCLLLAKAGTEAQSARVGDQTGDRVALFLHITDFRHDHAAMRERGVRFLEAPRSEPYGMVAVFEDLHGNRWDLLEPKRPNAPEQA